MIILHIVDFLEAPFDPVYGGGFKILADNLFRFNLNKDTKMQIENYSTDGMRIVDSIRHSGEFNEKGK